MKPAAAKKKVTGNGDCYESVLYLMLELDKPGIEVRVCHGWPIGQAGDAAGLKHGHAWVEVGDTVFDRANGKDVTMRRELYYKLGRIKASEVVRYSPKEAATNAIETGHCGPWSEAPADADA